ncbi:MAG: DUF1499 domain-containing protein [Gemmatimonadota bacterium]|nr:DUF1499 domain-containing protein [Gemmatimonadota bacterium]
MTDTIEESLGMAKTPLSTGSISSPSSPAEPSRRPLSRLAVLVALLAIAVGLLGVLAGFGSRWGWWPFRTGFSLLTWAAYGGIAVAVLSIVGVVRTRPGGPRRGLPLALFGLVAGLVLVGIPWQWRARAQGVPPIHDITTDTENPPQFVAVAPLRADAPNPIEYGGPEVAAQQREAYADIQSLVLEDPEDRVFERALSAARDMGWEIVATDSAAGRIEATDRTFWFGFEDDVVIRLTPMGGGTILDVRSVSRVGGGDAGTNARRVRAYLERVRDG